MARLRRDASAIGVVRTGLGARSPFEVQRRDARPHDPTGAAQLVEPRRVVFVDACGKNLGFPRRSGRFESFELRHDVGHRVRAFDARFRRDALPFEQEAHEVARFDRLDLAAQAD